MIRLLDSFDGSGLRDSHYSRLIRSHLSAYGTEYDFCRFYELFERKRAGIICVFNSSVTADFCEGASLSRLMKREIAEFADFQRPYSLELPHELALKSGFSGYKPHVRGFYEICPGESADGLINPEPEVFFKTLGLSPERYPVWLTDTVRRVNHGLEELWGYESSVLAVRFREERLAYITDLATPEKDRGKGHATALLGKVAARLWESGITAYLTALEDMSGFYSRGIFKQVGQDTVYILDKNEKNQEY